MNIKLNYIHLSNFKGTKDFQLAINGKNANVYGDNDRGKTTLKDAWNWLLFDKNSENIADTNFKIKPQDSLGQDINHLQTVVEAELSVDGKPLKLKKLREENWVTRRGTTEPVMDGHTKLYWFNEVPVKAREYQSKVDELINEDIFKKITDPLYFNTKIDWKDRRKTLLEISGDATDKEVIASDESLARLTELLKGRSIDDYKLVLADQLKGFKKERDDLPPRIDELVRSLPQEESDYTEVEDALLGFKDSLATIEFLMTNSSNKANELNKKHQELYSLKNKLEEVKIKIKSESGSDKKDLIDKKTELQGGQYLIKSGIDSLKMQIDQANRTLESNASTRATLLLTYQELNQLGETIRSKQFEDNAVGVATDCPTCNQKLPIETVHGKMTELKANFEKDKKERLDALQNRINANVTEGKNLKENTEKSKVTLIELQEELKEKELKLENITISIKALDEEISKPLVEPDYSTNHEYTMLVMNIEKLQAELNKPIEDKSTELLQKKANIQSKIDELNKILNGKSEIEKKKTRIEELKADEKRVSTLIAELEGYKFMLERFTVAKVNLLEDSINSQFKHVKFKLFEENITNEGIKETCIALVNTNGAYVPFADANSAGKVNAGIDVINSLSKFYGVTAPLWIDNRESVTKLADTESQVISLVVSEKDKILSVVVEE